MLRTILFVLLTCACAPPDVASREAELGSASALRGLVKFVFDDHGGNGRRCVTCHTAEGGFTLSPAQVQAAFACAPSGPLFRSIDSNDGVGSDFSQLLADGNFRIPLTLAANVHVEDCASRADCTVEPDGRHTVVFRRSSISTLNSAFEDFLMWDGREAGELERQASNAAELHFELAGGLPAHDRADIAAFERATFSSAQLKRYFLGGPPPELPRGRTASERRGREFFVDQGLETGRGLCAQCHGGPLLNTTNAFNIVQGPGDRFAGNESGELNAGGYELLPFVWDLPDGTQRRALLADPGMPMLTGTPCEDVPANCFLNPNPGQPNGLTSIFKIPSLWNVSATAPYFHDNSRVDLEDVLDHYQTFFFITYQGLLAGGFPEELASQILLDEQEKADIIAFLRLL